MGFFAEFDAWLRALLLNYIGAHTQRIAELLQPAFITLGTIYVMVWGYLHLTGQIEEPLSAGLKKIVTLAVLFGAGLQLWLYNEVIVDTFFEAPAQLAAGVIATPDPATGAVRAFDPVAVVDDIIFAGGDTADRLLAKAGILKGNFSFYLGAVAVYVIVGLTAIYTVFLLSLSRIALCILLALGPLFFMMLFFDSTKRLFESWIAQMVNYALITILTIMVASLMLHVLSAAADQAVAQGAGIKLADAVRVCMAAGLTFLIMRQIMPMAAGLASGVALSTFGALSRGMSWAFGGAAQRISRSSSQFGRGLLMDEDTSRWDSLSRKAGYHSKQGLKRLVRRDNHIRRDGRAALAPPVATGASQ